jgi:3-hydroxyacyl-CoA dehydrogenase/enoyl-CoA hydratase/3-hydroxybutyryl-CoA epimerase
MRRQRILRALETCGKPVAAAIEDSALGVGMEVALACHHRVAGGNSVARCGLTQVGYGLVPGCGGTQRLARAIGFAKAVPLLLESKRLRLGDARDAGLLDAIVAPGEQSAAATVWVQERLNAAAAVAQPWDVKGYAIPGGGVQGRAGVPFFMAASALLREKTYGNYPAARNALSCVYEGLQTDIDTGLKIESRYFVHTALSPEARNMLRLVRGVGDANRLESRPAGFETRRFAKVGVLGAGMMGAAIAFATARAGIPVVLIDASQSLADAGKEYARDERAKALVEATTDYARLEGCDLVVEAVFEDRALKAEVTQRAERVIAPDAIFASNTSTLPITGLARSSVRPQNFIGLHFFSPADRMPLVEIIVGEATGQPALAYAMDYVRAIGKTPIVVNDSRGFYTSRVFGTYITEGLILLARGVRAALIDNAGRIAGMPVGPLALTDEVSVELIYKINQQTRGDTGGAFVEPDAERVLLAMVETHGRLGKKTRQGFYDYAQDGSKRLWPELERHFTPAERQPAAGEVVERLIAIQSIEAVRCLEASIVARPIDADVGALLGWGYPAFRGGPIAWIDTLGTQRFASDAERLTTLHGMRFEPPRLLVDAAERGMPLYG